MIAIVLVKIIELITIKVTTRATIIGHSNKEAVCWKSVTVSLNVLKSIRCGTIKIVLRKRITVVVYRIGENISKNDSNTITCQRRVWCATITTTAQKWRADVNMNASNCCANRVATVNI